MARRKRDKGSIDTGRWLTTYADMMNNLLVLFMVLYAMSVLDLKKFEALSKQLGTTLSSNTQVEASITPDSKPSDTEIVIPDTPSSESIGDQSAQQFDDLYEKLKEGIEKNGYGEMIELEKESSFIKFKFKDSVLFFPDSPTMRPVGIEVLTYVGNLLTEVDQYTKNIEIGGHTAQTMPEDKATIFAWELSADRAISVLKYLVTNCGLVQSKMSIAGYSHYDPVGDNTTETGRSVNRRVEIKVVRITNDD